MDSILGEIKKENKQLTSDISDYKDIIDKLRIILRMNNELPDDQLVPLAQSIMKQLDNLKFPNDKA